MVVNPVPSKRPVFAVVVNRRSLRVVRSEVEAGVVNVVVDRVSVGIRLISAGLTVVTCMSNFGTLVVVSSMSILVKPDIKVGLFVDVDTVSKSDDANVV
jgi:hypothetical protein